MVIVGFAVLSDDYTVFTEACNEYVGQADVYIIGSATYKVHFGRLLAELFKKIMNSKTTNASIG